MSASAARDAAVKARLRRLAAVLRAGRMPPLRRLQTRSGLLQYALSGHGGAIVLLSGAGVALAGWRKLYPAIESLGTVFAWNRLGVQGSGAPKRPQSGARVVASLRELLAYAGLQPPYTLVGHSLGGLHANLFARLHPGEVSAVLFLEAAHPDDSGRLALSESRLARALGNLSSLPQRSFRANLHAELEAAQETADAIAAAGPFPAVPLAVVTGGVAPPRWLLPAKSLDHRRAHQLDLARLSPHGEQVIATRSGHFPQLSEPQLVLDVLARLQARSTR